MRKIFYCFLISILVLSFQAYASSNDLDFQIEIPEDLSRMPLIKNCANIKNTSGFAYYDGENISKKDLRLMFSEYSDSHNYMTKSDFWCGMTLVTGILSMLTFSGSLFCEDEGLVYLLNSASLCMLGSAGLCGYATIYHKNKAADFYNMHILKEFGLAK